MAAMVPITLFELDPDRFDVIAECTKDYGVAKDDSSEWPNNILSRRTVVYGSGRIARSGDELTTPSIRRSWTSTDGCRRSSRRLSSELATVTAVGMYSDADVEFRDFFIAGDVDDDIPAGISDALVRDYFAGMIFPATPITVEPVVEQGRWWSEVVGGVEDPGEVEERLAPWRKRIEWFESRPEFVAPAFVRIGSDEMLGTVRKKRWPDGTVKIACVFPRLPLGLTRGGSLVGLFGYSVQS